MAEDKNLSHVQGLELDNTLTRSTTVTIPEKAALSNTTTLTTSPFDKSPRPSKDDSIRSNPFDTDVEAGMNNSHELLENIQVTPSKMTLGQSHSKTECQVWPGKNDWKKKAKLAKANRSWGCMANMSPRNRIITKVLIIILVVGIAVAVGFGISKPLGAPIWGEQDRPN